MAEAEDSGTVPVWADGTAIRAYTYVDDLVEGVCMLMHSDLEGPVNIGSSECVAVDELVETVVEVAGKEIHKKYVEGPVGVQALCNTLLHGAGAEPFTSPTLRQSSGHRFSKARIHSLGWEVKVSLKEGVSRTYPWIEAQVEAWQARERKRKV